MYHLYFDGGSNPNPGPCAGSYILFREDKHIFSGGHFIENGTNNIGEYTGLLIGLERCLKNGMNENIKVFGDSLLVISQVTGKWKVKNEGLKPLYKKITELIKSFKNISFEHVKREFNKKADELSDHTLLLKKDWES